MFLTSYKLEHIQHSYIVYLFQVFLFASLCFLDPVEHALAMLRSLICLCLFFFVLIFLCLHYHPSPVIKHESPSL